MPPHISPEKRLAVLQDIMAGQDRRVDIAKKNNISLATVDRIRELYKKRRNGQTLTQLAGMPISNGHGGMTKQSKFQAKVNKLGESIDALRTVGVSIREIAERLKVSKGTVNYHLYLRKQPAKETQSIVVREPQSQNGGQLSGINKHVFVGIYVAESERLGHHISERFGVSSDFLRSGLSEFLEYTKVRKPPRIQD